MTWRTTLSVLGTYHAVGAVFRALLGPTMATWQSETAVAVTMLVAWGVIATVVRRRGR